MPHQVGVEFDGSASGQADATPFVELIGGVLSEDGTDEVSVTLLIAGDELLQRLNREH